MNLSEAEAIVAEILDPMPLAAFFDALDTGPVWQRGNPDHVRAQLFGTTPRQTICAAFESHAHRIAHHAEGATAPVPAATEVDSADAFDALVARYHDGGHTVRLPDVTALSPALQRFARALELLLLSPVEVLLFWSRAGARAPVHYDFRDNLVIQISGRKQWRVSRDSPSLHNNWPGLAEPPPVLAEPHIVILEPGDMLYVPRGLPHAVDTASDSIHLAVCFTPRTVRETLIAMLDHLSDEDCDLRRALSPRNRGSAREGIGATMTEALGRLSERVADARFIDAALQRRASRTIADLPRPTPRRADKPTTARTAVRHHPLAIAHVLPTPTLVDFSQPGEHINVHAGVADSLAFIAATPAFRVADIPGAIGDDVRVALVDRLIASGFLEHAD